MSGDCGEVAAEAVGAGVASASDGAGKLGNDVTGAGGLVGGLSAVVSADGVSVEGTGVVVGFAGTSVVGSPVVAGLTGASFVDCFGIVSATNVLTASRFGSADAAASGGVDCGAGCCAATGGIAGFTSGGGLPSGAGVALLAVVPFAVAPFVDSPTVVAVFLNSSRGSDLNGSAGVFAATVSVGGAEFWAMSGSSGGLSANQPRIPVTKTMAVPISTTAARAITAFVDCHQPPARKYSGISTPRGCSACADGVATGCIVAAAAAPDAAVWAGSMRMRWRSRASVAIVYIRCRAMGSTSAGAPSTIVST
jgi:hypothetical protein